MGRPKKTEAEKTGPGMPIRVDARVLFKLRIIAAFNGMTAPEYVNKHLAELATKEYAKLPEKIRQDAESEPD